MAELKTKVTEISAIDFLNGIDDEEKRKDSLTILQMMEAATGYEPIMWGSSMIGFGKYKYKYASGHQGEWFVIGLSPRKQSLTLYGLSLEIQQKLLADLGKYKTGKGCLYIKRLSEVKMDVLKELIETSVKYLKEKYKKVS